MYEIQNRIYQAKGDGAYDSKNCWDWVEENGVRGVFSPRKGVRFKLHGNSPEKPLQRAQNIRLRRQVGKKNRKKKTDDSRKSLAEAVMFRFKILLGETLNSNDNFSETGGKLLSNVGF